MKNENEARKCSSLYHRNNKSIYYVSFKQAGKMKRMLCFYWLPERSKQDGPLLVPRDLPRWILRPQLKIPLFGHIKTLYRPSFFDQDGWIMAPFFFAFLCLPLGFWIHKNVATVCLPTLLSHLVNNSYVNMSMLLGVILLKEDHDEKFESKFDPL